MRRGLSRKKAAASFAVTNGSTRVTGSSPESEGTEVGPNLDSGRTSGTDRINRALAGFALVLITTPKLTSFVTPFEISVKTAHQRFDRIFVWAYFPHAEGCPKRVERRR